MNIDEILASMSLKDKITLCSGKNFWMTKDLATYGIPSVFMCDGPHGLRKQPIGDGEKADMLGINESLPATCFPTAVTTGMSWDPALLEEIGRAIGEEAAGYTVSLVLGPGANIKRNPLCGRNFEYISEDPYLTGKIAAGLIRGLEENGVSASLKHFAFNNQEQNRFTSDSVLDERTAREIYLAGFEIAVKEGRPGTVMCAYNKWNGIHCSDEKRLLTDILRNEWGFDGMVVTDWGAMNDRIAAFSAGCDLNMPGGSAYMEKEALRAVKDGRLSESDINASARRVLELIARSGRITKKEYDKDAHHALARRAAEAGAVLLKNDNSILPLKTGQKTALIGSMAKEPRYQGAGSSHINPFRLTAVTNAMPEAIYAPGCDARGDTTDELLTEATKVARDADVAVVFAGLPARYESEGFDREDLKLPEGHLKMIDAVVRANPNTVVVLTAGGVVECPFADDVKAILYVGLPGEAGGEAIRNLLYGAINPSGKLTESWVYQYKDCINAEYYGKKNAQYREGIYIGYRYYDKAGIPVRWRFGYGLSYTTFAYSDLIADGKTVGVTVTNTGDRPGAEVVQLYIGAPEESKYRPVRELKGFEKVFLAPGESRRVIFPLSNRSFAIWQDGWRIPGGVYTAEVGGLSANINVDGEALDLATGTWYDHPVGTPEKTVWENALLGREYTEHEPVRGQYTMDNSVMEMKDHSLIMKIMYKVTENIIAKSCGGKDWENPDFRMQMLASVGGPLRGMQISGGIQGGLFRGMLDMANGHPFRGILKMMKK